MNNSLSSHLQRTTMERLTLAIIMTACLLVNASSSSSIASSSTLPFSPSSYGVLRSSHESHNNNVCTITQRQRQSNATVEQRSGVENNNSASSHVIHSLYNALNNFLLVRSAVVATKDLTSSPSASATHTSTTSSSPYNVGSIVELYKDESYFAAPAIVTSSSASSSTENTIMIQNTITNTYSTISTSYIHAYTTYDNGTRASCNVSAPNSNEAYMKPCVVNSHTLRPNSGLVLYEVSYLNEEDELVKEILPFSRVQRRRQPVIS